MAKTDNLDVDEFDDKTAAEMVDAAVDPVERPLKDDVKSSKRSENGRS